MGDFKFEVVQNFTYLGSEVTSDFDITNEIKRRILLANRCLYGLSKFMRSKITSRETKLKLYNELILPVLLYGSESWTLNVEDMQLLNVFERKVFRMIYGPVCINGEWRTRHNHELYALSRQKTVVEKINVKRMKWAGHVNRMDERLPARKALFTNPSGKGGRGKNSGRTRGGQMTKWKTQIDKETHKLGVRDWTYTSKDRVSWAKVIRQAESGNSSS